MTIENRGISPTPDFRVTVGRRTFSLFSGKSESSMKRIAHPYLPEVRHAFLEHGREIVPTLKPEERTLLLRHLLDGVRVSRDPEVRNTFLQMTGITLEASKFPSDTVLDELAHALHIRTHPANIADLINAGILMIPHLPPQTEVIEDMNDRYTRLITSSVKKPNPQQNLLGRLDEFTTAWRNPGTPITIRDSSELETPKIRVEIPRRLLRLSLPQLFELLSIPQNTDELQNIVSAVQRAGKQDRTTLLTEFVQFVKEQGHQINPAKIDQLIILGEELLPLFPFDESALRDIRKAFDQLIEDVLEVHDGYLYAKPIDAFRDKLG